MSDGVGRPDGIPWELPNHGSVAQLVHQIPQTFPKWISGSRAKGCYKIHNLRDKMSPLCWIKCQDMIPSWLPVSVDQPPILAVLGSILVPLLHAFSEWLPAFGPILDLRMSYWTHPHLPTIFKFPVSLRSYSLLAPPIQQPYHPISTLSLTWSLQASPTLFNLDFWYPNFHLSVAMHNFLFWTDWLPWSLHLAPFPFPCHNFLMSIPPSWSSDPIPTVNTIHNLWVSWAQLCPPVSLRALWVRLIPFSK